jgi:hypothetical protein
VGKWETTPAGRLKASAGRCAAEPYPKMSQTTARAGSDGGGPDCWAATRRFSKRRSFNSEIPSRFAIAARGIRAVTRSTKKACSAAVGRHGFAFAIV